jgi:trans-aconitate 2-methyltransferase
MPTWDADQYLRFDEERTRPCRELAARVTIAVPDGVVDLGCGPGNSTAVLAERWPTAELTGLDSSPEMIAAARRAGPRAAWCVRDIAAWANDSAPPTTSSSATRLGNGPTITWQYSPSC